MKYDEDRWESGWRNSANKSFGKGVKKLAVGAILGAIGAHKLISAGKDFGTAGAKSYIGKELQPKDRYSKKRKNDDEE